MKLSDLQNKTIAILGLGQEGMACAAYFSKKGLSPVLFDEREWKEFETSEQEEIKKLNLNFILGKEAFFELDGFEVLFRSPGIPPHHRQLSKYLYQNPKVELTSQTKFFFDNCKAKIIGITGTKGKGTTSSLIFQILKSNFQPNSKSVIHLTGNIGYRQPLDILDDLNPDDWVVFELSSFQLVDLQKSPHIAVVLMTTSEHLDYHKNIREYLDAKSAITRYQTADDTAIINRDYPSSMQIGELGHGKKIYFSKNLLPAFIDKSAIKLRGSHNLENIAAAVAAAKVLNINDKIINTIASGFKGLEHRLEYVGEKQEIKFYNDSFSTTPDTAIAAKKSFYEPLIVILGGSSKNSDFAELGRVINMSKNIKAIVLIGTEAPKIKKALQDGGSIKLFENAKNMQEIFTQIKSVAISGDTVVLSPACASFDMFKNYKDRGEQFKKCFQNLR